MKYLDKIYYGEPCNYEMAFYEYSKQMRNSSMQKFDRLIAMKALEHLEASIMLFETRWKSKLILTDKFMIDNYHPHNWDHNFPLIFCAILSDFGTNTTRWRNFVFQDPERIRRVQRTSDVAAAFSCTTQISKFAYRSQTMGRVLLMNHDAMMI